MSTQHCRRASDELQGDGRMLSLVTRVLVPLVVGLAFVGPPRQVAGQSTVILNDTFANGTRTIQNLPTSSQWFYGGAGTLTVVQPSGPMRADLTVGGTSSASWTTYFAPVGSPLALTNAGDSLKVTWEFTLDGVGAANTSQNFRLAVVQTPSGDRVSTDSPPGSAAYAGYGMFMNMGLTTLGNSNPFQLMERATPTASSALLSSGGSWTPLANGGTSGRAGFANAVPYTYSMELTKNLTGGLDITSRLSGGSLNDTGLESVTYTDATPNSLTFDTFSIRPSSATGAAQIFDTRLVKVEYTSAVPEPAAMLLPGLAVGWLLVQHRLRR